MKKQPTQSEKISSHKRFALEAVDQQANADHLGGAECVREAKERDRHHAPADEIIARTHVQAERATGGQQHHQNEDRDQKPAGIAGRR